jgi:hypothetical protein
MAGSQDSLAIGTLIFQGSSVCLAHQGRRSDNCAAPFVCDSVNGVFIVCNRLSNPSRWCYASGARAQ